MYTHVIFDLDGTLLDTLEDLHQSVNQALCSFGYPTRSLAEVRSFVGNGVGRLVALSVPAGTSSAQEALCLARFKEIYSQHCHDHTRPYPYIKELLTHLKSAGVGVGIVSNKFDGAVKALADLYFDGLVDVAVGEREDQGVRKKPYPDTVFEAMAQMGASPDTCVYVGDSEVDVQTSLNAGLSCLCVTWGFRTPDQLKEAGATHLFDTAQELEKYLISL